jgi:hypothetical protein
MRPHVEINLHNYIAKATEINPVDGHIETGIMKYNDFFIKIEATNDYSLDNNNRASINIKFKYKENQHSIAGLLFGLLTVIVTMSFFAFLYFLINYLNSRANPQPLKVSTHFSRSTYAT